MDETTPALQVNGVTKRYGSPEAGLVAVDHIDFTVERGEVFGFLGPMRAPFDFSLWLCDTSYYNNMALWDFAGCSYTTPHLRLGTTKEKGLRSHRRSILR